MLLRPKMSTVRKCAYAYSSVVLYPSPGIYSTHSVRRPHPPQTDPRAHQNSHLRSSTIWQGPLCRSSWSWPSCIPQGRGVHEYEGNNIPSGRARSYGAYSDELRYVRGDSGKPSQLYIQCVFSWHLSNVQQDIHHFIDDLQRYERSNVNCSFLVTTGKPWHNNPGGDWRWPRSSSCLWPFWQDTSWATFLSAIRFFLLIQGCCRREWISKICGRFITIILT